jgi:hypothetical protein
MNLYDIVKITTAKLADLSVTAAKLADLSVVTAKLADLSVTAAKLANLSVTTAKLDDLSVTTAKIENGDITAPKLSGAQTGPAPIFGIRAWVSFQGAGANGPAGILQDGNVSSVTKNADGDYTITFDTALPTDDYAVFGTGSETPGLIGAAVTIKTRTTTQCNILVADGSTLVAKNRVTVAFVA